MRNRSNFTILVFLAAATFGSWLLFTAETTPHELLLGAGSALLTAWATAITWRSMKLHLSFTFRQALTVWRLPWYLVTGAWEMLVILARSFLQPPGSFYRAANFNTAKDSRGTAQTVLATAYMTAAPNFIVLGANRGKLLFHQIERSGVPRLVTDLEARP